MAATRLFAAALLLLACFALVAAQVETEAVPSTKKHHHVKHHAPPPHHYAKHAYGHPQKPAEPEAEYYENTHFHGPEQCKGTAARPVRRVTLPSGEVFCLRMPRFLTNPELDVTGTKKFARTWNDTCGLYGIVFSPFVPAGAGPPPHIHFAEDEWFLPANESDIVRIHAEKKTAKTTYTQYVPGQVPGFNMPPVEVGGVEVKGGSIGYAPIATAHTWKAATNLTNFMAIWGYGFAMKAGVNIPEAGTDAEEVLEKTGLWGIPTDITSGMFGGPEFAAKARGPLALPAVSWEILERLQSLFDDGEKGCCGKACGAEDKDGYGMEDDDEGKDEHEGKGDDGKGKGGKY